MLEAQSPVALATLSDHASLDDLLGYGPYVATLDDILTQPSVATPFSVGVFGPWGTGKSSFMLQLRERLERRGLSVVWFQPWLFDEKEEVWKALILSILQYLEDKTADQKQVARIRSLIVGVGKIAVNHVVSRATGLDLAVEQVAQAYADASSDNTRFINTFRRDFEQVKDAVLSNNNRPNARLYIFVDDLDRCTPENCVRVLEAIRLFFDLEGCLFILGIDQEVVQKGIEIKYDQRLQMRGRDYLDKLIQLPFTLPPVADKSFAAFVDSTTAPFKFQEQSKKLIALASERNPRRVKRLSNCLELLRTAGRIMAKNAPGREVLGSPDAERHLAFLLALQIRFPIASRWLIENLEYIGDSEFMNHSKEGFVSWLEATYSRATSMKVADEAISFVNRAHQDDLVARDWKDKGAFASVTALVDTNFREAERPKRLVIDNQYAQTESTQAEPEPATPSSGTSKPTAHDVGEEQEKHVDRLVQEVRDAVASLDGAIEPSFTSVIFGVNDRLVQRASGRLDEVLSAVNALKGLNPSAVPIGAQVIADGHGRRQMSGLLDYITNIGRRLVGVGLLPPLALALTWGWFELSGGLGGFALSAIASGEVMPAWLASALALLTPGSLLRGFLIVSYGRRERRKLQSESGER